MGTDLRSNSDQRPCRRRVGAVSRDRSGNISGETRPLPCTSQLAYEDTNRSALCHARYGDIALLHTATERLICCVRTQFKIEAEKEDR